MLFPIVTFVLDCCLLFGDTAGQNA